MVVKNGDPMKYEVRTATGSLYLIDTTEKTWARAHKTSESGFIRVRESGTYNDIGGVEPGQRMALLLDSITPGATGRVIITSEVCFVDRVDDTLSPALSVHTNHLGAVSA